MIITTFLLNTVRKRFLRVAITQKTEAFLGNVWNRIRMKNKNKNNNNKNYNTLASFVELQQEVVRGAPWSAANRLHGQRTGAFSWRPVLGLSRKTDQFRLDPTQNCAPGWSCDRESSVYHLALEMYSGIFRHATNPMALSRMLTKHQLHPCPHPTHHSHDYHTHTPTANSPTAFHAQL